MQTKALTGAQAQRTATFKEWAAVKRQEAEGWLNGGSEFFTAIAGFKVTRREAVAVNAIAALISVAAMAAAGCWPVAAASLTVAVGIVRWLNAEERKGGEK